MTRYIKGKDGKFVGSVGDGVVAPSSIHAPVVFPVVEPEKPSGLVALYARLIGRPSGLPVMPAEQRAELRKTFELLKSAHPEFAVQRMLMGTNGDLYGPVGGGQASIVRFAFEGKKFSESGVQSTMSCLEGGVPDGSRRAAGLVLNTLIHMAHTSVPQSTKTLARLYQLVDRYPADGPYSTGSFVAETSDEDRDAQMYYQMERAAFLEKPNQSLVSVLAAHCSRCGKFVTAGSSACAGRSCARLSTVNWAQAMMKAASAETWLERPGVESTPEFRNVTWNQLNAVTGSAPANVKYDLLEDYVTYQRAVIEGSPALSSGFGTRIINDYHHQGRRLAADPGSDPSDPADAYEPDLRDDAYCVTLDSAEYSLLVSQVVANTYDRVMVSPETVNEERLRLKMIEAGRTLASSQVALPHHQEGLLESIYRKTMNAYQGGHALAVESHQSARRSTFDDVQAGRYSTQTRGFALGGSAEVSSNVEVSTPSLAGLATGAVLGGSAGLAVKAGGNAKINRSTQSGETYQEQSTVVTEAGGSVTTRREFSSSLPVEVQHLVTAYEGYRARLLS